VAGWIQDKIIDAGGGITSQGLAFTSNVTAKSTLVAFVRSGAAAGNVTSVSDNVNGAWTKRFSQAQTTDGHSLDCWYKLNATAGATTVTVAQGSATLRFTIVEGVADATNGDALDTSASSQGDAGTTASSGAITTAAAVEWLVAGGSSANLAGWVLGSGWTNLQSGGGSVKVASESQLTAASGSYTGTLTWSGSSDNWAAGVIAFKSAAGGGGSFNPVPHMTNYRRRMRGSVFN
jgi:hypothetical protein